MAAPTSERVESFLPAIYDIIKFSLDRDPTELTNKIAVLKQQFQTAKEEIEKLPGTELSPEQQLEQMEVLRCQLISKSELLRKYKHLTISDSPSSL